MSGGRAYKMSEEVAERCRMVQRLRADRVTWPELAVRFGVGETTLRQQQRAFEAGETAGRLLDLAVVRVPKVEARVQAACPHGVRRGGVMTARCDGMVTRCVCLNASGSEALTRQPREAGSRSSLRSSDEPGSGLCLSTCNGGKGSPRLRPGSCDAKGVTEPASTRSPEGRQGASKYSARRTDHDLF